MADGKFVIYQYGHGLGLGHILVGLMNVAKFCAANGAVLCIDMRNFPYFSSDRHEKFASTFKLVTDAPLGIIMDLEIIDNLLASEDVRQALDHSSLLEIAKSENYTMRLPGTWLEHIYYLHDKYNPHFFRFELVGPIGESILNRIKSTFPETRVIGVHYRHGNGEFLQGRPQPLDNSIYSDLGDVAGEYISAISQLCEIKGYEDVRIFVASDNTRFINKMKSMDSRCFSLADVEPKPDLPFFERIVQTGGDDLILVEAATDLWSLSSCHHIIAGRSLFSHCAALISEHIDANSFTTLTDREFDALLAKGQICEAAVFAMRAFSNDFSPYFYNLLERASLALNLQDLASLAEKWKSMLELRQSDTISRASQEAAASGRVDEAASLLRRYLDTRGGNPFIVYDLVNHLLFLGKSEDALRLSMEAIDEYPGLAFLRHQAAHLVARIGDISEAVRLSMSAVRIAWGTNKIHNDYLKHLCEINRKPWLAQLTFYHAAKDLRYALNNIEQTRSLLVSTFSASLINDAQGKKISGVLDKIKSLRLAVHNGYYVCVDFGAYNDRNISYELHMSGWRGLVVGPGGRHSDDMMMARPNDIFLSTCLSDLNLRDLCQEAGTPVGFDFLEVVSSNNAVQILRSLDFDAFRPAIIFCDHRSGWDSSRDVQAFLSNRGYMMLQSTPHGVLAAIELPNISLQ